MPFFFVETPPNSIQCLIYPKDPSPIIPSSKTSFFKCPKSQKYKFCFNAKSITKTQMFEQVGKHTPLLEYENNIYKKQSNEPVEIFDSRIPEK
jgi:hypothetical protein